MDDDAPRIEVIGDDEPADGDHAVRPERWHAVMRTGAAVVGAAALLWGASSAAGMRANSDREQCRAEVESTRFVMQEYAYNSGNTSRGIPEYEPRVIEPLLDKARACGLDEYADSLERLYVEAARDED